MSWLTDLPKFIKLSGKAKYICLFLYWKQAVRM